MSLYQQMKDDRMAAMLAQDKNKKNVLSVFVGDLQTHEKRGTEITDAFVIAQAKKAITNADDNLKLRYSVEDENTTLILSSYLPKQLSINELTTIITPLVEQGMKMGDIMKTLKEQHSGTYDGKDAATVIKQLQ